VKEQKNDRLVGGAYTVVRRRRTGSQQARKRQPAEREAANVEEIAAPKSAWCGVREAEHFSTSWRVFSPTAGR
jgi:hypothetical protein